MLDQRKTKLKSLNKKFERRKRTVELEKMQWHECDGYNISLGIDKNNTKLIDTW